MLSGSFTRWMNKAWGETVFLCWKEKSRERKKKKNHYITKKVIPAWEILFTGSSTTWPYIYISTANSGFVLVFWKMIQFLASQMTHQQIDRSINLVWDARSLFHLSYTNLMSSPKSFDWTPFTTIMIRNLQTMHCINKWFTVFSSTPHSTQTIFGFVKENISWFVSQLSWWIFVQVMMA